MSGRCEVLRVSVVMAIVVVVGSPCKDCAGEKEGKTVMRVVNEGNGHAWPSTWSGLKPRRGSLDRNLGMGWIVRHIVMWHGDGSAQSEICRYRRATFNRTNLSVDA